MFKFMLAVAAALLAAACANQPKPVAHKPAIHSIAIIPATSPAKYTLENVSGVQFLIPLAATANYLDSKEKAKAFNEKLAAQPLALGQSFTEAIATQLKEYGYKVEVLSDISRAPDDLDDVDYKKITSTADAVLHLKLEEVGLFSPRSSSNYLPRVNAHGTLFLRGFKDELYDEDIYYGVDARKEKASSIVADEKIAYPTFEAVVVDIDEVRKAFETGVQAVSRRMSEQIRDSLK